MKKLYYLFMFVGCFEVSRNAVAQDIPLFSQKLTNSFMYNPAVAGVSTGSLTYSFRQSYGNIANAPKTNFLSFHTPLSNYRFGVGVNLYQEDVNFLRTTYASAAFAYHIRFNRVNSLSFGVSGEYNTMRLSGVTNSTVEDPDYQNLASGSINDPDFSFGMLFTGKFFKAGIAANRLATAWIKNDNQYVLSSFYSGFIQGTIPLRGGDDLLEPYVAFRKFSETNTTFDIGLYYTYDNKILAGASFRNGSVAAATLGLQLSNKLMLGYSREMYLSDYRSQVGSTNEFTLRYNFNEYNYKSNFRSDYKNALAYRRKSVTKYGGMKTPSQLHKHQKKLVPYSPNKRYVPKRNMSTKKKAYTNYNFNQRTKYKKPKLKKKPYNQPGRRLF